MKLSWRLGIAAGIFLAIFTLYPQFKMWYLRGDDWQGHYAYNDIDEVAYSSYVKALIDGRPRKNDPYTGRDDEAANPQPESLFSIQFAAPYAVAIPARIFGVDAPWAMTIAGGVAGFLAALAAFWLIGLITGNSFYAMTGSLLMLAGGALAAGEGAIGEILDFSYSYPYFPAFRRYIPAVPFSVFLALIALVWLMLNTASRRRRTIFGVLAVVSFAFINFSYFYTWTTAAAWLASLGVVWLIARPDGFKRDLRTFAALAGGCALSLAPYAYLLSKRSHTMDEVQLLVSSHAPDWNRVPIFISLFVLVVIGAAIAMKKMTWRATETLFAISFALVPIVVFNQQVLTGRELQPIHYQVFIGNYVAGLALVVTFGILAKNCELFGKTLTTAAVTVLAVVSVAWGFVECHYTVRVLDDANVERDSGFEVGRFLTEQYALNGDNHKTIVFTWSMLQGDDLPTIAPQSVLWARHQHVFAGVTWQENKERYYQYMMFQGISPEALADSMKTKGDFVSIIALFGWGRHTDRLNSGYKPLTFGEIDEEVARYAAYVSEFEPRKSPETILSYVSVPNDWDVDFETIDKWYQRDKIGQFKAYDVYRLTLK